MKTRISCTLLFLSDQNINVNNWISESVVQAVCYLFSVCWLVCLFCGAFVCVCVLCLSVWNYNVLDIKQNVCMFFFCFIEKKCFALLSSINVQFFIILNLFSVSVVDVADLMLLLFGIITLLGHSSLFFVSFFVSFNI